MRFLKHLTENKTSYENQVSMERGNACNQEERETFIIIEGLLETCQGGRTSPHARIRNQGGMTSLHACL